MIILYSNYGNRLILVLYKISGIVKFDKNVKVWYNKEVVFMKKEFDKNMIDLKNRKVLKNLIYVTTISMAVIGALFIPQIINSRVKLSKTTQEEQSIEIAKNSLVSEENLNTSKKTVSRGDSDIRTATVNKNKEEVKETEKEVKADTKKENNK